MTVFKKDHWRNPKGWGRFFGASIECRLTGTGSVSTMRSIDSLLLRINFDPAK
jgi:hypothetical protein